MLCGARAALRCACAVCVCFAVPRGSGGVLFSVVSLQTTGLPLSSLYCNWKLPSKCGPVSSMQRSILSDSGLRFACLVRRRCWPAVQRWQQSQELRAWKYLEFFLLLLPSQN